MEIKRIVEAGYRALPFVGLLAISFCAFSNAQKRMVLWRDGNECQFPEPHDCGNIDHQNGEKKLHIHHGGPQLHLKRLGIDPDTPYNALTVCERIHIGPTPSIHHPQYKVEGEYWDSSLDSEILDTAIERTEAFMKQFPGQMERVFPNLREKR